MKSIVSYILNLYFRLTFFRKAFWSLLTFIIFAISIVIIFQSDRVSTKPVGWEKSFQVSSYNIRAKNVKISSRGNFIVAVYEGKEGRRQGIYASVSFDGGIRFLKPVKVADINSLIATNPHAAISGSGLITVMWHNYIEDESTNRIFHSTSKDFGANWTDTLPLKLGYEMEMLPRIYYDDRNILHLFFHGSGEEAINLFHAVSEDGENFKTTGSLIRLTRRMRGAFFPSIHVSGKKIFIVWQGKEEDFSDDLFFIKSSNYGRSWSSKRQITFSAGNNESPAIVLYNDILYLVYQNNDDKNWSIKMIKGFERGSDWDRKPLTVSTTKANCYSPALGVSGNYIVIIWHDTRDGKAKIYTRRYSVRDNRLMPEAKLSLRNFAAKNSQVLTAGRRFLVFWEERNIIMAKYSDVYVEPPVVYSDTNPREKWSRLPFARVKWKAPYDESGIVGYATIVNKIPDFNPSIKNVQADINRKLLPDIDDGVTYFHIRAIDGAGNFSRTVHYKLRVSVNPLPRPVIVSTTHPQGKSAPSNSPLFRWAVDDTERLKGFVYSLSKDEFKKPDKFISDFNTRFKNLEQGNYFFSIAAIDTTNQFSRTAIYDFVVGKGKEIDPEYLKKIAKDDTRLKKKFRKESIKKYTVSKAPYIVINFPFDKRKSFEKDSFKALIVAKNIRPGKVVGYSVYVDNKRRKLIDIINSKSNILSARGLKDGEYYIGVKCKYSAVVAGRKKYFWTKPYISKITINIPGERSPLEYYTLRIIEKFTHNAGFVTLTFLGLTLLLTVVGFGPKILFYSKLMQFKMKLLFR